MRRRIGRRRNVQAFRALRDLQTLVEGPMPRFSRRSFLAMAATNAVFATLTACTSASQRGAAAHVPTTDPLPEQLPQFSVDAGSGDYRQMYAATFDGGFDIPAVPIEQIDPK